MSGAPPAPALSAPPRGEGRDVQRACFSRVGQESCFRSQNSTEWSRKGPLQMTTDKSILLVEDKKDDELLTLRILSKHHIANRVVVVRDGVDALDYLFGTGGQPAGEMSSLPELVLLDLNLPRVDGLEILRRIRADERTRRLPVVILSSSKEEDDVIQSYGRGAHAYIRKPMDFGELMEAIGTMGLFWLVLNEAP
jgi:two-component system response regulator